VPVVAPNPAVGVVVLAKHRSQARAAIAATACLGATTIAGSSPRSGTVVVPAARVVLTLSAVVFVAHANKV